jgi:MarR family transcriptional regulator for hemolysin
MLLQYDFEESVGYWVVMAAHALQKALNEELAPHGITFRQWQILAWLALDGPLSQAELAERMDVEPATVVSVLGRMERDGWITREDCPTDRRKRLVHPTERVKPVWEQGVACARRVRARATRGFKAGDRERLKFLLGSMLDNLQAGRREPAGANAN